MIADTGSIPVHRSNIFKMKVIKTFFCSKELKKYFKGDVYNGKRKDLKGYLETSKPQKKSK